MYDTQRAIIFANGVLESLEWLRDFLQPNDYLIAVDGGYRYLKHLHRLPHLVVGDLDSIEKLDLEKLKDSRVEIIQYPLEKDETDLELALEHVAQRGYKKIRIIAGFGGRLDQTLANICLLDQPNLRGLDLRIEGDGEEAFLIHSSGIVIGEIGETVSLLPLGVVVHGVTTQGLEYPLAGEILIPYQARGVSNVMTAPLATITIEGGSLLCIHLRKL